MEENHMGWTLVSGVRADLVNLFKLFSKTNSVRYEDFCKVWKELNFSLIYRCRVTFIEALEFTEEIFQIVKEYLFSVYEFSTRVAALYTLYGLYFKQPIREGAKIRFTKSEWEEVFGLISQCKAEKQFDAVFIHLKMYVNGAYNFTATIRPAGMEIGHRKYSKKRVCHSPNNCDLELLYRPVISEKLVNSLVQLESLYCKKKSELLGKRNIEFIDGNFAVSLQQELKNYASKCQRLTPEAGTSNSDKTQPENEGAIRVQLKNKAYKRKVNEETNEERREEEQQEQQEQQQQEQQEQQEQQQQQQNIESALQEKKREKLGRKYFNLLAKKKAELFIKRLREKYAETEPNSDSDNASFSLPDLDSLDSLDS